MIQQIKACAETAGQHIWKLYQGEPLSVTTKEDNSPVTQADLEANAIISQRLRSLGDIPILSEEAVPKKQERLSWDRYWLVDPLDGTKGFIQRTGDFTVNIALIENKTPVLGVIYVPKTGDTYWAEAGKGAWKNSERISNTRSGPPTIAVASKLHQGDETEWMHSLGVTETVNVNSSLKLCWLAEGKADLYPRLKPTMEWDTGAGEVLLSEAGCKIQSLPQLQPMPHNDSDLMNPHFLAFRQNLVFNVREGQNLPELTEVKQ